jgi:carbon monoxide dehydrogenase subunit G
MCEQDPFKGLEFVKRISGGGGNQCKLGYSEEQVFSTLGQEMKVHIILVDFEPAQKAVFKFAGDFDGTVTYLVVPEGDNSRLTCIFEVSAPLPPGMSYNAVQNELEKNVDQALEAVKRNVEK